MADAPASPPALIQTVRQRFLDKLADGLAGVADALAEQLRRQCDQQTQGRFAQRAYEDDQRFREARETWVEALDQAVRSGDLGTCGATEFVPTAMVDQWSVLDDEQMQHQLLQSRTMLVIDETCRQEGRRLALRLRRLAGGAEADDADEEAGDPGLASASELASCAVALWQHAGLDLGLWERQHDTLDTALAAAALAAYRDANQGLKDAGVLPDLEARGAELRPRWQRSSPSARGADAGEPSLPAAGAAPPPGVAPDGGGAAASGLAPSAAAPGAYPFAPPYGVAPGWMGGLPPAAPTVAGSAPLYVGGVLQGATAPFGAASAGGGAGAAGGQAAAAAGFPGGAMPMPFPGAPAGMVLVPGGAMAVPLAGAGAAGASAAAAGAETVMSGAPLPVIGFPPGAAGAAPLGAVSWPGAAAAGGAASDVMGRLQAYARAPGGVATGAGATVASGPMLLTVVPLTQLLAQAGQQLRVQAEAAGEMERRAANGQGVAFMLAGVQAGSAELRKAAPGGDRRAAIELVSMMFEQILAENRLPGGIRILLARLQVAVLRVALSDDDFFANPQHPARLLLDRIGSSALGFDASAPTLDVLETQVRRVVEIIESYPETGRKVFEVALTEFENFLRTHLSETTLGVREAVDLVEQVERRETLVIQYTIELRKLLEGVECHEMVREFLLQVWPQVMALAAMRGDGGDDREVQTCKRVALRLLWATAPKADRAARTEVLRQMPALLQGLRHGMQLVQLPAARQDDYIRRFSDALAEAFRSQSPALTGVEFEDLAGRLAQLEAALPELGDADLPLDRDAVELYAGIRRDNLEVVVDDKAAPGDAALGAVRAWGLGQWFERRQPRVQRLQLAWKGKRGRLFLFTDPATGQCILYQRHALAAAFEAQALLPLELEPLTLRVSRQVLARIEEAKGQAA